MASKIFNQENIIFGVIWGLLAYFIGTILVKIITFIDFILGKILDTVLWVFLAPLKIIEFIPLLSGPLKIASVILLAIIVSPIARVIFEKIRDLFRRSPV